MSSTFSSARPDAGSDFQSAIETLCASGKPTFDPADFELFDRFRLALARGEIRAAERSDDGAWRVNAWVKRGILMGFRMGRLVEMPGVGMSFFDKHTYPLRDTTIGENVRIVPGGSSIRDGAYVAGGVVIMPPAYVNVGAYVDEGTMIDSHVLVGSCAQVGRRVHLSAAVQIGGVLEPPGSLPVIVEDECFLGGGCGVYEGTLIRRRAVLAPGVILTGSTALYDLVRGQIYHRGETGTLEVPESAVVVPGTRPGSGASAKDWGIGLYAPVIVKYRDPKTDAATSLEQALR